MLNLYDIAYWTGLAAASPWWLLDRHARQKVLRALRLRRGPVAPRADSGPAVLIHAVSLGELNAARGLIEQLRLTRPDLHLIITSTTETGLARARELYGPRSRSLPGGPAPGLLDDPEPVHPYTVLHFPLDFTPAVTGLLEAMRPAAVVLLELELWPNFLRQCEARRIPVLVVNGRMTEHSCRRYRLLGPLARRMFGRLHAACVQDETHARRFAQCGTPPERISITGTMKFDSAQTDVSPAAVQALCTDVGLRPAALAAESGPAEPVWVCGSTGPGEEELILEVYRRLLARVARLRLVIVPRKPERFDAVADLITAAGFEVIRRSQTLPATRQGQLLAFLAGGLAPQGRPAEPARTLLPPVILGDTMGELRLFYALADVVFVGRALVDLGPRQHGSDMIEPAALGKAVITGPFTGNFAEVMARLRAGGGVVEATGSDDLAAAVAELLTNPARRADLGRRARQVVLESRGATQRHAARILELLADASSSAGASPRS
jgi:3-deoxy-D-manno-octulosonic-acid transferase